jgi:peptidoglycan hydrolase-like protein with peptidoglycan-binding domain
MAKAAGASAKDIQEAQKLFNKMKDYIVRENGEMDEATVAAIKKFQRESGMRETGTLDAGLLKALRTASSMGGPPKYQITLSGKTYLLTDADYKALIERVKNDFRKPMMRLKSSVVEARSIYDDMKKLNNDQYIVSFIINTANRTSLPSDSVVKNAEAMVGAAEKALNAGDFKVLGNMFPKAQKAADEARKAMKDYCSSVIDGAGSIVTGLEFVRDTSFFALGVLAVPATATLGLGAVATGAVAAAGTNAVESIATEVGKGIAGSSEGFGKATLNVLRDSSIGAAAGALTGGKAGEKFVGLLAKNLAPKLAGTFFQKASQAVVLKWITAYFRANGANILEGIVTDTLKGLKSSAQSMTWDAFAGIVAKQVLTAGIFSKFAKLGEVSSKAVMAKLPAKTVKDLVAQLGPKGNEKMLEETIGKVVDEFSKEGGGKIYDAILGSLTGKESPEVIEKKLVEEFAANRKLLDSIKDEVEKIAKKRK